MIVSLFASCSSDAVLPAEDGEGEAFSDFVTEVSASCGGFSVGLSRSEGDGAKKPVKSSNPEDKDYILGMKEFKEGDKIYILQRGPSLTPKFPGNYFDRRNAAHKENNIYVYKYDPDHGSANWGDGYNFKLKSEWSDPIKWSDVKSNGSIGNSFVFFAFCDNLRDLEPDDNDPLLKFWNTTPGQITASPDFGPVTYYHHAYGGQWKKSDKVGGNYDYSNDWHVYHYQNHCGVPDFMGAYHTTSTLYSRPRFKFYHLLAYVRVTLYVPVEQTYEDTDPVTKKPVKRITGYDETAFVLTNDGTGDNNGQGAEIDDYRAGVNIGNHVSANRVLRTRFTIDWNANRSSDKDAPMTQVLTNANTPGFIYYYCMYLHNPRDITDLRYKPKTAEEDLKAIEEGIGVEDLDVTEFVNNGANARYLTQQENNDGASIYIDRVRRYEFSAAMPAQSIPTSGDVGGKTATKTLVDIHVRAPGTKDYTQLYNGTKNNRHNTFVEYTLSSDNFTAGKNDFELKQGTITHLHIYLPRVDDKAILVKAEVKPWEETSAEMAVAPDDWKND